MWTVNEDRESMAGSAIMYIVMTILATTLLGTTDALTMDQARQAGKVMRNICVPKTGVSPDKAEAASKGQFDPDDRNLKCYMKCVMGMMQSVKNGQFKPDLAISMAKKMLPENIAERIAVGLVKCGDEWSKYADTCDASFAVTVCTYEADPEIFFFP